jgi:hypothetical protein
MNSGAKIELVGRGSHFGSVIESPEDPGWVEKRLDPKIKPDPDAFRRTFELAKQYLKDSMPEYQILTDDAGSPFVKQEQIISAEASGQAEKEAKARSLDGFLLRIIDMYEQTYANGDGKMPSIPPILEDTPRTKKDKKDANLIFGRSVLRPDEAPRFYAVDTYPLDTVSIMEFSRTMHQWIDLLEGIAYQGQVPESELESPRKYELAIDELSQRG